MLLEAPSTAVEVWAVVEEAGAEEEEETEGSAEEEDDVPGVAAVVSEGVVVEAAVVVGCACCEVSVCRVVWVCTWVLVSTGTDVVAGGLAGKLSDVDVSCAVLGAAVLLATSVLAVEDGRTVVAGVAALDTAVLAFPSCRFACKGPPTAAAAPGT